MLITAPVDAQMIDVVQSLRRAGVEPVIIGSVGLALRAPALLEGLPADLDLLLPDDRAALSTFVRVLAARGAAVTSWEDPVTESLEVDLAGRFYLRARLPREGGKGLVVDATYECPWVPYAEARSRATDVRGVLVAALDDLFALLRARGAPRDERVLARAAEGMR